MSIAIGHPQRRGRTWCELMARRRQHMLATGLQRVLDDARRPPRGLTARVAVRTDQVLDAADDLEALAARLRDPDRPVGDEVVTETAALLRDGDGPIFAWAEPGTLRRRVRVISQAME